ncbi:MAG: radical SAM protein [Blastocatellia bacterium]
MGIASMTAWRLNPQTRLRRASGGGAAFLPETATTVELDEEAFAALALLSTARTARDMRRRLIGRFNRNFTIAEIEILLRELGRQRFVVEAQNAPADSINRQPPVNYAQSLPTAPESVHLQVNNVCNLRCPSCYVGLREDDDGSLPLERILSLIDEWAEMGVFQLALGGGEPLMSPKFAPVVRYARKRGIVPNVTTNGRLITEELLDETAGGLGELRMSLNDAVSVNKALIEEKAALLRARDTRFGFNLIVTRQNLDRLSELLRWALAQGAATINLIRPKPAPGNERWYQHNALTPADSARLASTLPRLEPHFSKTNLTVDCAFSFLFHGWPAEELWARGVAGCAMGERFATVKWNGDVYPCSHLHGAEFNAGNVKHKSFCEIWQSGPVFSRVRREIGQVSGACGACGHKAFCKGCRAVMQRQTGDWLAADDECGAAPASLLTINLQRPITVELKS